MSTELGIAFPAAALAAGSFAASAVLQQRAARDAPEDESLSWRLIVDLLHRRSWLAGMGCVVVGYLLQALAFGYAPIALVEPVIGMEIVLALPLAAHLRHVRLGAREWSGASCVVVGVAAFLALCHAAGGGADPGLTRWAIVAMPTVVLVAGSLVAARGPESPRRAVLLALAAGLVFSLMALVTQSFVQLLGEVGLPGALESWQPYTVALIGPLGFTIGQSAYQAGPLAMSLPVIDSVEPTIAVVLAAVAFRQHISLAPLHLFGEVGGGAIAILGIFLLGRSPLVLSVYEQTQKAKEKGESTGGVRAGPG